MNAFYERITELLEFGSYNKSEVIYPDDDKLIGLVTDGHSSLTILSGCRDRAHKLDEFFLDIDGVRELQKCLNKTFPVES